MKLLSKTSQLETEFVLDHRCVSLEVNEDLPCLRVWDPEDMDREVGRFYLIPDACQKLAAQALCADSANNWQATAQTARNAILESRGRFVAMAQDACSGHEPSHELANLHRDESVLSAKAVSQLGLVATSAPRAREIREVPEQLIRHTERLWNKPPGWLDTLPFEEREVVLHSTLILTELK